jgi:hypothetical protein
VDRPVAFAPAIELLVQKQMREREGDQAEER